MELTPSLAETIVTIATSYLGREYIWRQFDCVDFVRTVYEAAGIAFPTLSANLPPPRDFHLSEEELGSMPLGHLVFLKRRASTLDRLWTHVAIVYSATGFIHCSRQPCFGRQVCVTPKATMLEVYAVSPKPPA